MSRGDHHRTTADVIALLVVLARHGGVLRTRDIAQAAAIHRDTARRILRELTAHEWVRCLDADTDGERWSLGPELPRLGLDYQRRLARTAERLFADHQRLMQPLTQED